MKTQHPPDILVTFSSLWIPCGGKSSIRPDERFWFETAAMPSPFSLEGSSSFFVYSQSFRIRCYLVTVSFCAFLCFFPLAYSESYERTDMSIEKCLLEEKDDLCLIGRKNDFYYRWCNLQTVERIHMTEYGAQVPRDTPWLVIGRYAAEPSNGNTQFFFNGRLCPGTNEAYHAEVTFTCCPGGRKRDDILSIDEIRPCLYIIEVCTSCHCDESSLTMINDRQIKETESTWSVKSEKRTSMQRNQSNSFAQILNEHEFLDADDERSSTIDNTETSELDQLSQHIDEEMEQIKIEHELQARKQIEEQKKTEAKRAEASAKSEQGEKHTVAVEQAFKRERKEKERKEKERKEKERKELKKTQTREPEAYGRLINENDKIEGKIEGTRTLKDLVNSINLKSLKDRVKRMFYHGYKNYMSKAFPMDELSPISCSGSVQKQTGGTMLTLIDTLDTLVVLGDYEEFVKGVRIVSDMASYRIDQNVSVFETNIRILGGLLSAHILALDRRRLGITEAFLNTPPHLPYDGKLLDLAVNLGDRLIPAFDTKTGIPYGTVNLLKGVPPKETPISSLAGAGTLYLELGLLSSLSKDPKYAEISRRGMIELFSRRNKKTDLFGAHIDTKSGSWTEAHAGVGSNADSKLQTETRCRQLHAQLKNALTYDLFLVLRYRFL